MAKAGELVASALISVRTSERMQAFVAEAQEQNKLLQSQEEEFIMEQMNSTQEEMQRREQELLQRLAEKEGGQEGY